MPLPIGLYGRTVREGSRTLTVLVLNQLSLPVGLHARVATIRERTRTSIFQNLILAPLPVGLRGQKSSRGGDRTHDNLINSEARYRFATRHHIARPRLERGIEDPKSSVIPLDHRAK